MKVIAKWRRKKSWTWVSWSQLVSSLGERHAAYAGYDQIERYGVNWRRLLKKDIIIETSSIWESSKRINARFSDNVLWFLVKERITWSKAFNSFLISSCIWQMAATVVISKRDEIDGSSSITWERWFTAMRMIHFFSANTVRLAYEITLKLITRMTKSEQIIETNWVEWVLHSRLCSW